MTENNFDLKGGDLMEGKLLERQQVLADCIWNSQDPILNLILNKGLEYYVLRERDSLVKDIFQKDTEVELGCMDGRDQRRRIATAGSGVFWTPEQKLKVVEQLKKSNIKVRSVCRHRDCGAENLVVKNLMQDGVSQQEAEQVVVDKVTNFARHLDVPLKWIDGMSHSIYHYERSLFLIGTEMFDISLMPSLHPFQLNVRFSPDIDAVLQRIDLAIDGIAFGNHGPGKEKFKRTPFVICVVGDSAVPEFGFDSLSKHLAPLLERYGDLVEVRGFDVPKKYLPNR